MKPGDSSGTYLWSFSLIFRCNLLAILTFGLNKELNMPKYWLLRHLRYNESELSEF